MSVIIRRKRKLDKNSEPVRENGKSIFVYNVYYYNLFYGEFESIGEVELELGRLSKISIIETIKHKEYKIRVELKDMKYKEDIFKSTEKLFEKINNLLMYAASMTSEAKAKSKGIKPSLTKK